MKRKAMLLLCLGIIVAMVFSSLPAMADGGLTKISKPAANFTIPSDLKVDWNIRHTYKDIQSIMEKLSSQYPEYTKMYSIGHSNQEKDLWCLEITNENNSNKQKTGIGIIANIHGGEQESGESAIYTAWWILLNSNSDYVQYILNNYIVYVVPIINPDAHTQSFVYNTRHNLHPSDNNGDGVIFSDPYTDINGDGVIADIYKGTANSKIKNRIKIGMESPDWDKNGKLGDDPRSSQIDLNRSFDYQWNRYDIETYAKKNAILVGENSLANAGYLAGMEPETQAIQNFMYNKPMNALVTLHTGQQSVLWPRCYDGNNFNDPKDQELAMMAQTGEKMVKALVDTTGRSFYCKSSHDDYPSSGDLIDFAFGRLNIHAYTVEVYEGGMPATAPNAPEWDKHTWKNTLPQPTWQFYSQANVKKVLHLDPKKLGLKANEGLWFNNTVKAMMSGKAPQDQDILVEGAKNAILVMIEDEPFGAGYQRPEYIQWQINK